MHSNCFRKNFGSEFGGQATAKLNRLDRMEDFLELRCRSRRRARFVGIVDVVVAAIEQVQSFERDAPRFVDLIAGLGVDQNGLAGAVESVRGQIARARNLTMKTGSWKRRYANRPKRVPSPAFSQIPKETAAEE